MTHLETALIETVWKMEIADDDWNQKRHDALLAKARRRGWHYLGLDLRWGRRVFVYFFTGQMDGAEEVGGIEAIAAELAINIEDLTPPERLEAGRKRKRIVFLCKDWQSKRPRDEVKAELIGYRHYADDAFEEASALAEGFETWTRPGAFFEYGNARFFNLPAEAVAEAESTEPNGARLKELRFVYNTLGYVLTHDAYDELFPGRREQEEEATGHPASRGFFGS